MKIYYLAAAALCAVLASGCVTTNTMSSISLAPHDAAAEINVFNTAEAAATGYLRLPLCGVAPCRTKAATAAVIAAVHDGRKVRNYLLAQLVASNGGPIPVANLAALQKEISLVQSVLQGN